jgi:hypothetical protein
LKSVIKECSIIRAALPTVGALLAQPMREAAMTAFAKSWRGGMALRVARGLFRLWLVLSVVWIAITAGTVPARAWIVRKWQCGKVEVTLRKYATKTPMDLTFNAIPMR